MGLTRRRLILRGSTMTMGAAALLVAGTSVVGADPALSGEQGNNDRSRTVSVVRDRAKADAADPAVNGENNPKDTGERKDKKPSDPKPRPLTRTTRVRGGRGGGGSLNCPRDSCRE